MNAPTRLPSPRTVSEERQRVIDQRNAHIRFMAGIGEEDEAPGDNGAARMATAARESE